MSPIEQSESPSQVYSYILLSSNVLFFIAVFAALCMLKPFGLFPALYSNPDDLIAVIPQMSNKIYQLVSTGLENFTFAVLAFGMDRIVMIASNLRPTLSEKRMTTGQANYIRFVRPQVNLSFCDPNE